MKNITIISLLLVLLTACAAPVANPTLTTTSSPTQIPVATSSLQVLEQTLPTATASEPIKDESTPVFDLNTTDKIEIISFTERLDNVLTPGGAVVSGSFNLGESIIRTGKLSEINITDALGGKLLLRIAYVLSHQKQDEPTNQQLEEYGQVLAKVQQGDLPCSATEADTYAFDKNVPGTNQLPMKLQMFCGQGQLTEGATLIDNIVVTYMNIGWEIDEAADKYIIPETMPRLAAPLDGSGGCAYEIEVDDTTLQIKVVVSARWGVNPEWQLATNTELMFYWLQRNDEAIPLQRFSSNNSFANKGKKLINEGFSAH